jgi:acyl-CoA reductase-like NAD-dependent aldehyde dehydrogenase
VTPAYIALSVACTLLLVSGPTIFRRLRSARFERLLIHGRGAMPGLTEIKPLGDRFTVLEENQEGLGVLIESHSADIAAAGHAAAEAVIHAAAAANAASEARSAAVSAAERADRALEIAEVTQNTVVRIETLLTPNGGTSIADDIKRNVSALERVESRLTESAN